MSQNRDSSNLVLTKAERQGIATTRLFDAWYSTLSPDEKQQFWTLNRAEQIETFKRSKIGQQIKSTFE